MKKTAHLPWFTLCASAVVLALGFSPSWSATLQLERTVFEQHDYWRLFGAHLTHWTAGHLACELAAFLACGWFIEQRSRLQMVSTVVVAAPAVALAVLALAPHIETYRGLSGIVAALFAAATVGLMRRAAAAHSRLAGLLAAAAIVALVGKTVVELVVARSTELVVGSDSAPVPIAHLAGIAVGLCIALLTRASASSTGHGFHGTSGLPRLRKATQFADGLQGTPWSSRPHENPSPDPGCRHAVVRRASFAESHQGR